ncbi:MAG: hypothetical protein KME35_03790 [Aphanocapsa sp. GSE-SYN-MK-11-07L]|jgi:hypothetical protein|nr:hypothetical protein [Aphanocapsa sp. GSE-SYN-MK-11-07L]
MSAANSLPTVPQPHPAAAESLKLAQTLAEQLSIQSNDWHRLKSNRKVRALEQAAAAIVFLLKDRPEEALVRLQQAVGWLDRSISAPPCPTHGDRANAAEQISLNSQAENCAD